MILKERLFWSLFFCYLLLEEHSIDKNFSSNSMKTLTLILLFLGSGALYAQNTPIITNRSLKSSDANVLFRGFENIVELKKKPGDTNTYVLTSTDCIISTTRNDGTKLIPGTFVFKVRIAKDVKVNVYRKSDMAKPVMTLNYTVMNLPSGQVYLDESVEGGGLTPSLGKISIKQSFESPLLWQEEVTKWNVSLDGEDFSGTGNMLLPETLEKLKNLTPGTPIILMCHSIGEDRIMRKRSAQFIVR